MRGAEDPSAALVLELPVPLARVHPLGRALWVLETALGDLLGLRTDTDSGAPARRGLFCFHRQKHEQKR